MFDHEEEKALITTDEYYHKECYICPNTSNIYDLSHLFSYEYIHKYDDGSSINCKVKYRTHVYTKGIQDCGIKHEEYNRSKVVNIEIKTKGKSKGAQYRFFSESRYRLSLELNALLKKCYNNQIRFNSNGNGSYSAYPYLKLGNNEKQYYCIFLSIWRDKTLNDLAHIRIESAYIETRPLAIKSHLHAKTVKLSTIMNKLK